MSSAAPPPSRWRFLVQPRWLAWHLFAVAAVAGMLWLGDWQFHRALDGNGLSWAYTFEWPVFAVFGVVFWAKTILDEARLKGSAGDSAGAAEAGEPSEAGGSGGPGGGTVLPAGARRGAAAAEPEQDAEDPELDQYNAYLARLNRQANGRGRGQG
jgi:hypothetical protein